jgi:DnaJ-class molecular chaperone
MNYYKILNVNKNATKKQIRDAYKELVIKYHPDKNSDDNSKIKDIINAYTTLSDDKKREEYDYCNFNLNTLEEIIQNSDVEFINLK